MLLFTSAAAAVALVLLFGTDIGESTEPSFYVGSGWNLSYVLVNGTMIGNVNMTWDDGTHYFGGMVYTDQGYIYRHGWGKMLYGISGVTFEGYFEMAIGGHPSGNGSLYMPLPKPLLNVTLDGCINCMQYPDDDGQWWLIVTAPDGEIMAGNGWVLVFSNRNISQHGAYVYTNNPSGQFGFGTFNNETKIEGRGFLSVIEPIYNVTGALLQECPAVPGFPNADEEALLSKIPKSLKSYWTNGTFYEGEMFADHPSGMGNMTLFSGETIEGQFYEGKPVCTPTVWFGTETNCKTAANKKKITRKPKTFKGVCTGVNKLKAFFVGGVPGIWLKN